MTWNPVLPPWLLFGIAALFIAVQVVTLRRWRLAQRDRTALWRWAGLTCAGLLLIVASLRVVITDADEAVTRSAGDDQPNVFLLVDRSPDMAVRDLDGRTRMDVARDDLQTLIDRYPHGRFTVIGFSATPTLDWPLSADTWSLKPVLESVTPYAYSSDAVEQTNAGAASTVLRYQLISAVQQYPRAKTLVFYLGAGARESRLPARQFEPPEGSVDGGAVIGYGTRAGGPIPGTDVGRSPIDDTSLRAVADQLQVPYVDRSTDDAFAAALPEGGAESGSEPVVTAARGQTETYWVPASIAAVLLLIELYFVLRDLRRSRLAGVEVAP